MTRYVPSVFQILAASRDVTVFQLVFIPVPISSPFCSASLSLRRSHISIPVSSEFPLPLGVVCPPPLPAPPLASDPFCPPNFPSALSQVIYWSCTGLVLVLYWSCTGLVLVLLGCTSSWQFSPHSKSVFKPSPNMLASRLFFVGFVLSSSCPWSSSCPGSVLIPMSVTAGVSCSERTGRTGSPLALPTFTLGMVQESACCHLQAQRSLTEGRKEEMFII